ncbi:MAG: hypothetical protein KKF56_00010 [Nanoarchaeota archaeon]|nr:hypothetical protein [Nanoarchaeota archaeon]
MAREETQIDAPRFDKCIPNEVIIRGRLGNVDEAGKVSYDIQDGQVVYRSPTTKLIEPIVRLADDEFFAPEELERSCEGQEHMLLSRRAVDGREFVFDFKRFDNKHWVEIEPTGDPDDFVRMYSKTGCFDGGMEVGYHDPSGFFESWPSRLRKQKRDARNFMIKAGAVAVAVGTAAYFIFR